MQVSEVSKRYAQALYQLSSENGSGDNLLKDLRTIKEALSDVDSAVRILDAPVLSQEDKEQFIEATFGKSLKTEKVRDFLKLLLSKGRIDHILEIIEAYELTSDEANNVLRGSVRSAAKISDSQRAQLEELIAKRLGKKVIFQYIEEPDLIGGLVIQVGSYLFDGTIDTQIRMLNEDLTRRAH